ncbi:MAG: hypothetical protein M3429_09740 [Verrucomicrobiota bacterium]|nr:hypothetical protein [Verrucomicrobiota bacterium]
MNLIDAHRLLLAGSRQGEQQVLVSDRFEAAQLQEMAAAGLVVVTRPGTLTAPSIILERLTDLGRTFLRDFPQGPPGAEIPLAIPERSESEIRADTCAVAIGKWRGKFAAMQQAEIH